MSGDGNLSDSSCSAVSGLSLRDGGNQRQLVNPNLNLSISSTSGDAHDPKTREILRLRAENADLKRRLQDIDDSSDDDDGQGNDANKLLESSLEAEQKEHRADLARLTDEIGDLQEENRFFQNDATESKQEIKRLLLVIDDRDSSIRQRNEDLLASQASNAGFQETINELQTTLDNKQRFMDQLMQQIRNESDN